MNILLGCGNGSFENQTSLSTGKASSPISIVVANFNYDNQLDIAVVNLGTDNIGIFLGYGDGQFSPQSTYSTGQNSFPSSLAVSDFNRDGALDIVVANYNKDNVGVFVGDGKFVPQIIYSVGKNSLPILVAVADVNNDHQVDIVVLNSGASTVGILLGFDDGTFQSQKTFSIGTFSYPTSIAVDDLNNDGIIDIAVANAQTGEEHVLILLGDGHGDFSKHSKYLTGISSGLCSAVIGYFDNDTQLDIAIINNHTKNVAVLLGYGDGTFFHTF